MGEDQDPEVAGRLDEAGRGDRLARSGGMAEAVAARRARVLALEHRLVGLIVDHAGIEVVVLLVEVGGVALADLGRLPVAMPVPVLLRLRAGSTRSARSACPASASTWWRRSSVPEAVAGVGEARTRSRPSMSP